MIYVNTWDETSSRYLSRRSHEYSTGSTWVQYNDIMIPCTLSTMYCTQLNSWYGIALIIPSTTVFSTSFFFWTLLTPRLIKYLKWFGSYFHTQIHSLTHISLLVSQPPTSPKSTSPPTYNWVLVRVFRLSGVLKNSSLFPWFLPRNIS